MITSPHQLRERAEEQASKFPPLLARAAQLASTVLLGEHGRRRSGLGDDFWQYRPMQSGDSRRMIDWRRSAKSDGQFVREKEWQTAQSVLFWVDQADSMRFASDKNLPQKSERARILALATSLLLIRGGERVGLTGGLLQPQSGETQILRLADLLSKDQDQDYSSPDARGLPPNARAVFISDFLTDTAEVTAAIAKASDRGVRGVLLQLLDPSEEFFPYKGRTIFQSVGGSISHQTLKADDLRQRYLDRLARRKEELITLCATSGWSYHCHHTNESETSALLWLFHALEGETR